MDKNKRSRRELDSLYTDFIAKTKRYQWNNQSENELIALLQECVEHEERIPEAYSVLKEIIRRKTGLSLFDTQLMAAYSMQQGRIAELPTGEGKTLAAVVVVTAAILALQKKSIHVLVFNDYLARRDYAANLPIYTACGVTCAFIDKTSDFAHRKAAYSCDVVYVSAKEAAFDYLRSFLCTEKEQLLFERFPIALVDEADSILIDEARIPLVLAGNANVQFSISAQISSAVAELLECDYEVNLSDNQAWLTEVGIAAMERTLCLDNLYMPENAETLALINAALEAQFLLKKDKDYIVKNSSILVIDKATGRVAENRRFPDLLHQAVEMLELGSQDEQTVIYNSMSMQAFLLQYEMLCGMTGTAASSSSELWTMYGLKVDVIPPHIPCVRIDHPDLIYLDKEEQQAAILSRIQSSHDRGQPVLIGTQSVQESEYFSALLAKRNIKHCILNARNDVEEAEIIAGAGKPYQITISTNMAGRGVDIRLGGKDGNQADFVCTVGGLFVISAGINRSLRIDNQLRGRAGRQGDPGESQFFVCLNDLQMETFFEIEFYEYTKYPKLLRRAQKIQEGEDAEARYMLERYSQILEKQLILYFVNINWAAYLAAMEDKRSGIHLMVIGDRNPLAEYQIFAVSAFNEMMADIRCSVAQYMQKCVITDNGIDMEEAGLSGATTTWTYMINESSNQFSRIPYLVKSMSNTIQGTVFTLQGLMRKLKKWLFDKLALRKKM